MFIFMLAAHFVKQRSLVCSQEGIQQISRMQGLSCLTEIWGLYNGAILNFNNRNLIFNPLSTKMSNKNFRFIYFLHA